MCNYPFIQILSAFFCLPNYTPTHPLYAFSIELCEPGSVVGIATAYRLDGPGIESRWVRDFTYLSRPALRPTHPPVKWVPGLSRGKVRPGRDADPPPSSAEVKNIVELYLYSPYGPLWTMKGWNLPTIELSFQTYKDNTLNSVISIYLSEL